MTLTTTNNRKDYTGNGAILIFAYDFLIVANADLGVYLDGVKKTLTTDYTVSGAGLPTGGNVTFVVAPGSGVAVSIIREVGYTQSVAYVENQKFPAATHEGALDRLTMLCQQLLEKVGRAATFKVQSLLTNPVMADGVIGKILRWKTTTELENVDVAILGTIVVPVTVAQGGTGTTTLVSGAYLKGAGAGAITTQATPIPVADGGTGVGAFTLGSLVFAGIGGVYTQDNPNLFWDNTNKRLGIGTATPVSPLQISATPAASSGLLHLRPAAGQKGYITFTENAVADQGAIGFDNAGTTMNFYTGGSLTTGTVKLAIQSGGNVGIGVLAPTASLHLAGTTLLAPNLVRGTNTNLLITETGSTGTEDNTGSQSLRFNLTNTANNVKRALGMTVEQRSGAGTINAGGILVSIFTQPDNGGDTSGIYVRQTGGGNAISAFNFSAQRPAGYELYSSQGRAIEASADGTKKVIVAESLNGSSFVGMILDGGTGECFLARPQILDTVLTRRAFVVKNAAETIETFAVALNGEVALRPVGVATTKSVSEGAVDSGGAGFKVLRVPN